MNYELGIGNFMRMLERSIGDVGVAVRASIRGDGVLIKFPGQ